MPRFPHLSSAIRVTLAAAALVTCTSVTAFSSEAVGIADSSDQKKELTALEEVTVLAQRTTEEVARNAEFTAPNLINLTTANEIKRLPDVNAGEAVGRVPGISLETDTGEGRFINIRGLDSDLNSTTFGGQRMPPSSPASPFGGGRAVAFDSIPIGFVGASLVTKTLLPEQDAEALGGTIDITPKTVPQDGKPFANLRLGTGYEELRSTYITDLAATVGTRFGGDGTYQPFSLLVSGAYHEDKRGIDDVEPSYWNADNGATPGVPDKAFDDIQQRYYRYHRKRSAYGAELGYDPDQANHYYLRYFNTGYTEQVNRQILDIQPNVQNGDGSLTFAQSPTNANVYTDVFSTVKTNRYEQETLDVKMYAAGGKNEFDGKTLDYQLGYAEGTYVKPYDYNATWTTNASGTLTYNDTTTSRPGTWSFSGYDPTDPKNYTLAGINNFTGNNDDKETSFKVNLQIPTNWGGGEKESVKIGASARLRDRTQTAQAFRADPTALGNLNIPLANSVIGGNVTYYDGRYQNGPNVDPNAVIAAYNAVPHPGNPRYAGPDGFEPSYFQHDKEDIYALYAEYAWSFGPLGFIGGLRGEKTAATYEGNAFNRKNPSQITPTSVSHGYTDLFPSAQVRYELDKDLILRGAISTSIARPGFNQINPNQQIDLGNLAVTTGNPDLKPAHALSFDVSIEKALSHAGVLSFGLFDKEITDYIVPFNSKGPLSTASYFGLPAGSIFASTTFENGDKAHARGFEFSYTQRLKDILPGALGGFGYALNYTYVDSQITVLANTPSAYSSPLPSSSKNTWNATLMYETKDVELTLGAMYVGRNLFGYNGGPSTDIYSAPRLTLDFGAQYKINETVSAFVNLKNLLNTPLMFTYGPSDNLPIQREFYKTTAMAGITLDF